MDSDLQYNTFKTALHMYSLAHVLNWVLQKILQIGKSFTIISEKILWIKKVKNGANIFILILKYLPWETKQDNLRTLLHGLKLNGGYSNGRTEFGQAL